MGWDGEERRREAHAERLAALEKEVKILRTELDSIETKLDIIIEEMTRSKGFVRGALFIVTGGYFVAQLFGDVISKHL